MNRNQYGLVICFFGVLQLFVYSIESTAQPITTMISRSSNGALGNENSYSPSISADGRYVAFASAASNIVIGDTNEIPDVFVRDRQTGKNTMVSVVNFSDPNSFGSSDSPIISADGRYIIFCSAVVRDHNTIGQVFVRDLQENWTVMVSSNPAGYGTPGNSVSFSPSISINGIMAYTSYANNLVPDDTNNRSDIFVVNGTILPWQVTRVSVDSNGVIGNGNSFYSSISTDGRYVVYASYANNLVIGDTNNESDIFVHDRQTGKTIRISVDSSGAEGNEGSDFSSISADGRYVAFDSYASNLIIGDTNNENDVFVHDLQTGKTIRISVDSSGAEGNQSSSRPSISADGRYVAFNSDASNLIIGDTNNESDIFVHDCQTGQTSRTSVHSNGVEGNSSSFVPSISADGNFVAFKSDASNLVIGDTNYRSDVFVRDQLSAFPEFSKFPWPMFLPAITKGVK